MHSSVSMQEFVFDTGEYQLKYRQISKGIAVTGYQGFSWAVQVPEEMEGQLVTAVDRKAFLSKKNLREIHLPTGVQSIGDWAFAYCSNLERVTIPESCSSLGKSLFLDCERLECISGIYRSRVDIAEERRGDVTQQTDRISEAWSQETGRLLAAAVTWLEAYYLLEPTAVGSPEWLRRWDARLEAVMNAEDQEGYSKQVLCGEEDYGSTDLNAFLQAKRQKKVRLAMLRLLCSEGLLPEARQRLADYLTAHTLGCESEESWQVLLAEGEVHPEYISLFLQLGGVTRENIAAMM